MSQQNAESERVREAIVELRRDAAATQNAESVVLSASQEAAIKIIRANPKGSYLGESNRPSSNTVNWRSAEALERAGLVEVFLGADGRFARLATEPTS